MWCLDFLFVFFVPRAKKAVEAVQRAGNKGIAPSTRWSNHNMITPTSPQLSYLTKLKFSHGTADF